MILVTRFGPYKESDNASGVLVRSLKNELTKELAPLQDALAFEVITCDDTSRDTEHQTFEAQLIELLKRYEPSLCVHTGQAPLYNKITIEKIATNSFMQETIDPDRPVAYWSSLPGTEGLRPILEDQDIPACYSYYCWQHLCNHILYSSLHFAEMHGGSHKAGFIHVPLLPDQVTREHRDSPYMPLEVSRRALSVVVNHVAKTHRHNKELNLSRGAGAPLAY